MTQQESTMTPIVPRFVVDTPPFMHRGYTIASMMRDKIIALVPAAAMAIYMYGIPAARVMALSAGTAVLAEYLWDKILGRKDRLYDLTSLTIGLLFAFLLPAGAPWWLVITGSAFSVILGRQVFGGLGCNPLCPALVGWAAMTVAWPMFMDPMAMTLQTTLVEPLQKIKFFGYASLPEGSELSLFLGQQLGGLGSSQVAAVLLGGLYMCVRKAVRWEIPVAFLASVLLVGGIFWYLAPQIGLNPATTPPPHLYLLTGSTMFAAFFLATDPSSSPVALGGICIYGLLAGSLLVLIRIFGIYLDSAPFAILLASLVTPMCDLVRAAPYGRRK
ncbi:RnfABCDGE type electron transport complex subunit D [Desulfovibrio sp. OttesenSCG-928-A18]|nr:RnfABCDGE type electron transport complex subunit D [Desulfovibrio sp. OttesenSCG-928-A18]